MLRYPIGAVDWNDCLADHRTTRRKRNLSVSIKCRTHLQSIHVLVNHVARLQHDFNHSVYTVRVQDPENTGKF